MEPKAATEDGAAPLKVRKMRKAAIEAVRSIHPVWRRGAPATAAAAASRSPPPLALLSPAWASLVRVYACCCLAARRVYHLGAFRASRCSSADGTCTTASCSLEKRWRGMLASRCATACAGPPSAWLSLLGLRSN